MLLNFHMTNQHRYIQRYEDRQRPDSTRHTHKETVHVRVTERKLVVVENSLFSYWNELIGKFGTSHSRLLHKYWKSFSIHTKTQTNKTKCNSWHSLAVTLFFAPPFFHSIHIHIKFEPGLRNSCHLFFFNSKRLFEGCRKFLHVCSSCKLKTRTASVTTVQTF